MTQSPYAGPAVKVKGTPLSLETSLRLAAEGKARLNTRTDFWSKSAPVEETPAEPEYVPQVTNFGMHAPDIETLRSQASLLRPEPSVKQERARTRRDNSNFGGDVEMDDTRRFPSPYRIA